MDCLFCKIGARSISSEMIYEDSDTYAFLDIHPRAPGHTVVIPKHHAGNILNLDSAHVNSLFNTVKRVTGMLQEALRPAGFTIGINHGLVSGQTVDHIHVHVIPRFDGDGGTSLHSVVHNPPRESLDIIAKKIRRE